MVHFNRLKHGSEMESHRPGSSSLAWTHNDAKHEVVLLAKDHSKKNWGNHKEKTRWKDE